LGKFARVVLRTSQIDYNGRFCMSSAAAASIKAFGIDRGLPFPLEDIPRADVVLLAGGNPAETMPPIMQYFEAQRRKGGALIVVDPRQTPTLQATTLHLRLTPGTDAALANGLLHILVRDGLINEDYIRARTEGFEQVKSAVAAYWPARVEQITGVPEAQLQQAAQRTRGRAAIARRQQHARLYQHRAGARPGRQALRRLWLFDRAGQWAGRARARPEGRPTAGLSPD
jgi:assimilatory nitrate reductase catalytic subunit